MAGEGGREEGGREEGGREEGGREEGEIASFTQEIPSKIRFTFTVQGHDLLALLPFLLCILH